MNNRLYVLTRDDLGETLSPSYQAVQGAHALAQFMLDEPDIAGDWDNNYLIFLSVRHSDELEFWMWKLDKLGIPYVCFREPDLNDEITAIAVKPKEDEIDLFKNLKLMGA